jgi:hypothetical protein
MAFDMERFERAKFEPRRKVVAVESLAAFFAEGEAPEWEVRGLTANELHRAMEASRRQGSMEAIVKAMATNAEQVSTMRKALGLSNDTPGEIAKRLEMLVMGSVAPAIELPAAVKLAEAFPVEFLMLTNEITELTGKGAEMGKPAAVSQPTPA